MARASRRVKKPTGRFFSQSIMNEQNLLFMCRAVELKPDRWTLLYVRDGKNLTSPFSLPSFSVREAACISRVTDMIVRNSTDSALT